MAQGVDPLLCKLVHVGGRTFRVQGSAAGAVAAQPRPRQVVKPAMDDTPAYMEGEGADDTQPPDAEIDEDVDDPSIAEDGGSFMARVSCDSDVSRPPTCPARC
jgi:hypothetical protein